MENKTAFAYCLNTSTIRECKLGVVEEIQLAAETGYAGIELWAAEIDTYRKGGGKLPELKKQLEQANLKVPNIIAFFQWANPDKAQRQKGLEEAKELIGVAQAIGCVYIAAPPAGITDRPEIPLADIAGYYSDLLGVFRGTGVKPLLEFWGHSQILGKLSEAMQVLQMVNDPEAVLLADVFHMAKTPGSFELLNELDGKRLGLFHVNDYPYASDIKQLKDSERVYPGDGVAPLGQILDTLRKIGFSGMLSLELFNKGYQERGAAHVVRTGLEKLKRALEAR